jgi:hypothetical protein
MLASHGPVACDDGLRRHAEACDVCRDVMTIARLLQDDREAARGDVPVPAAGQVWWRAAVRARLEAAQAAARPMTWLYGIAGACAAGLAATVLGLGWPSIVRAAAWLGARASAITPEPPAVAELATAAAQRSLPFALVAAACLILAPLVLYLASSDD